MIIFIFSVTSIETARSQSKQHPSLRRQGLDWEDDDADDLDEHNDEIDRHQYSKFANLSGLCVMHLENSSFF